MKPFNCVKGIGLMAGFLLQAFSRLLMVRAGSAKAQAIKM
jgi:hypothetical protein